MGEDLIAAAARGECLAIARLLETGANPNSQDQHGETALHKAVEGGHASIAALLLVHGASHALTDGRGQTPLDPMRCPLEILHTIRQHYQRFKPGDISRDDSEDSRAWAADLDRDGIVRARGLISPEELSNLRGDFELFAN